MGKLHRIHFGRLEVVFLFSFWFLFETFTSTPSIARSWFIPPFQSAFGRYFLTISRKSGGYVASRKYQSTGETENEPPHHSIAPNNNKKKNRKNRNSHYNPYTYQTTNNQSNFTKGRMNKTERKKKGRKLSQHRSLFLFTIDDDGLEDGSFPGYGDRVGGE